MKEIDNFEELDLYMRIILKCATKNEIGVVWIGFTYLRTSDL
jgi:hypothetical protein